MFNRTCYNQSLTTRWLGKPFIYLEQAGSTNHILKEIPSGSLMHGTVLLADHQSDGRGQKQRRWIAEPGQNLTFTIALFPAKPDPPGRLTLLSLTAGLGVVRALQHQFQKGFYLKWPNDVMLSGRKLGGILTETVFYGSHLDRVLIGIGLNVNQTTFPEELDGAISVASASGDETSREKLLCRVLQEIEIAYGRWVLHDSTLIAEINERLSGVGKWVQITVNGTLVEGKIKFLGVDDNGHLLFLSSEFDVITYTHEQIHIIEPHT